MHPSVRYFHNLAGSALQCLHLGHFLDFCRVLQIKRPLASYFTPVDRYNYCAVLISVPLNASGRKVAKKDMLV
jgi:hypothetical protein